MDAIKNWIIDIDKSMQFKNSHLLIGIMVYEQLLHVPIQIRFPFEGTHVTCIGSKLTNSLGIRSWSLKLRQIYEPAGVRKRFLRNFPIFELGGITKQLMTGSSGNKEFCFPEALNIGVEGKQNSLFPLAWGQSLSTYYSML